MPVIAFEENRPIGKDFVQIFLVRKRLGTEHRVIPATAEDPVISRMFSGIFAQTLLNVGGVLCALKIHAAKTKGAVDKMDVAIYKTREYKFSAGVDHFCAHAAHLLDYGVVTDSDNLAAMNGHGLGPRLFWVFRVNAAVHDDDVRRFNHPSLRARYRGSAEQECERLKNGAKRLIFHPYLPL